MLERPSFTEGSNKIPGVLMNGEGEWSEVKDGTALLARR